METETADNSRQNEWSGAGDLSPARRLELLDEWRRALVAIVERDPDAHETRRALRDIEAQMHELGHFAQVSKKSKKM